MYLELLKNFCLKDPMSISPLYGESIYSVLAGEGSFVLKKIDKKLWGHEKIVEEHRLLAYLVAARIPVAYPLKTRWNATYLELEEYYYVLMPELSHCPMDFFSSESSRLYYEIGCSLANLHKALAGYPFPVNSYTIDPLDSLLKDIIPGLIVQRDHGFSICASILSISSNGRWATRKKRKRSCPFTVELWTDIIRSIHCQIRNGWHSGICCYMCNCHFIIGN